MEYNSVIKISHLLINEFFYESTWCVNSSTRFSGGYTTFFFLNMVYEAFLWL